MRVEMDYRDFFKLIVAKKDLFDVKYLEKLKRRRGKK